jgi:phenylacetate-CoA ligase
MENRFFDRERETLDWGKRRDRLNGRFLEIFRHAWQHSAAYGEIYRSSGIEASNIVGLEDLESLPMIRMDDLKERQKSFPPFGGFETIAQDHVRRIYVNPGLIWQPGEWHYRDNTWAEGLCGAGFRSGDRILNAFGYHMWPIGFMLDESVKMLGATVIPTGLGNTLMQVRVMKELEVNGFMGTPSFLMTLSQRAQGLGMDLKKDLSLERALVSAEMLPESLRVRLEDSLGISVRQVYGTTFLGCIGYECPHLKGFHVPDGMIVEIVDPQSGRQVAPGSVGEVVATNFNVAYPMIRMATGDLSMLSRETCPCGRTGPLLKKILGRIDQATKVKGNFIHPWQADEVISRYPEVFKYQVVITREEDRDVMTFMVELGGETGTRDRLKGRIERDIKEILAVKGHVRTVPRGSIPDGHRKIDDRRKWE